MKTKTLSLLALLLLATLTGALHAQVKDTVVAPKIERIEVREGNLTYSRYDRLIERASTKDLKGKSYEYAYVQVTQEDIKRIYDPIIRSVFPEERIKQLAGIRLVCMVFISPVEKKILHFQFSWRRNKDDTVPFTLSELDELERKLRSEPKFIKYYKDDDAYQDDDIFLKVISRGEIVDRSEAVQIPYRFESTGSINR